MASNSPPKANIFFCVVCDSCVSETGYDHTKNIHNCYDEAELLNNYVTAISLDTVIINFFSHYDINEPAKCPICKNTITTDFDQHIKSMHGLPDFLVNYNRYYKPNVTRTGTRTSETIEKTVTSTTIKTPIVVVDDKSKDTILYSGSPDSAEIESMVKKMNLGKEIEDVEAKEDDTEFLSEAGQTEPKRVEAGGQTWRYYQRGKMTCVEEVDPKADVKDEDKDLEKAGSFPKYLSERSGLALDDFLLPVIKKNEGSDESETTD